MYGDSMCALGYTVKREAFRDIRKEERDGYGYFGEELTEEADLFKSSARQCPECGFYWWGENNDECGECSDIMNKAEEIPCFVTK